MKNIILSIKNNWCQKIFSGEKTIEVRKVVPEAPFKAYIYDTASSGGTGTLVGEFTCEEIVELPKAFIDAESTKPEVTKFLKDACLELKDLQKYMSNLQADKAAKGLVIKKLIKYETPVPLSNMRLLSGDIPKRPPQSWCYVKSLD